MRSLRFRPNRWPFFGSLTIAWIVSSSLFAQSNESPGDSITSYVRQAQATGGGAAYGGHLFDPQKGLTTYGRAGSTQVLNAGPVFREASRTRSAEIAFGPGQLLDAPVGPIVGGDITFESGPIGGYSDGYGENCGGGCGNSCGGSCGSCGSCGECSIGGCGGCGFCDDPNCDECIPLCLPKFRHLSLSAGVHAFKGPRDSGNGNNFGFQEGVNISGRAPLLPRRVIGYQIGYQAVQSRLHGDATVGTGTDRSQHFVTAALFRRRKVGWQWGVAYDWMRDDLDAELDFTQIRAELGLVGPRGSEIGFMSATHTGDDTFTSGAQSFTYQTVDQYALYVRWYFCDCGEARLWGGMTDNSDGIFGGEFLVPVSESVSFQGGFNYLIPEESSAPTSAIEESWNLAFNLVWTPKCDACASFGSRFRSYFNVADNGSMFIDQAP